VWFRQSSLSVANLRILAIAGLLESVGVSGIALYPRLAVVAGGVALFLGGALMQGVIVLVGKHEISASASKDHPSSIASTTATRVKWTFLALLLPLYIVVTFGAAWAVKQLLPATTGPPPGGYAQTSAKVDATFPNDHDQVKYSYTVRGLTYQALWFADGPEGHASTLKVGQTITIWYEVNDPSKSCSCINPQELQRSSNDPTPLVLAMLVFLTAGFVLIAGRLIFGRWLAIVQWARELGSARRFTSAGKGPGTGA
jgi:hypothetical protein